MPELVYDAHRDEWRYAPSIREKTASVNGCGCMCHVGSGTRTSCEHCSRRRGNQCLICFDHGDSSTAGELVTVHRGCLDALERHPDAWSEEAFDQQKSRAEAAEQRVRELEERVRESERQLRELLASEPEDIDPRLDYLYLQVDRNAVTAARAFLQREEKT
jgi:hypothetical protein